MKKHEQHYWKMKTLLGPKKVGSFKFKPSRNSDVYTTATTIRWNQELVGYSSSKNTMVPSYQVSRKSHQNKTLNSSKDCINEISPVNSRSSLSKTILSQNYVKSGKVVKS